jgi:hypothetical protein
MCLAFPHFGLVRLTNRFGEEASNPPDTISRFEYFFESSLALLQGQLKHFVEGIKHVLRFRRFRWHGFSYLAAKECNERRTVLARAARSTFAFREKAS